MDDRDCYENCMHSTKITYVNSFSCGFNSKISHGSFFTNNRKRISSGFISSDKFELQFILKGNRNINTTLAKPFNA